MLDRKYIIDNEAQVVKNLAKRGADFAKHIQELITLEKKRRSLLQESEQIRHDRKSLQEQFRTDHSEPLKRKLKAISDKLKEIEGVIEDYGKQADEKALLLPNVLHEKVPIGSTSEENIEVYRDEKNLSQHKERQVIPHWEIKGQKHTIDFERASKIASSRFFSLSGDFARLERALINMMLDAHRSRGYQEKVVPYFANANSFIGTGQFPKFTEDVFKIEGRDLYSIPTAEVPLVNLYQNTIIEERHLDIAMVAFSPCFRSEAGSYGVDTKGLMRLHQFHKVELVKITHPDRSDEGLEKLVMDARHILDLLELPYRVVTLCSGDIGFASALTYDIEVWVPSSQSFREISSCSNCLDFQARRAKIRYRPKGTGTKPSFAHTLNGSGLAVGRTFLALVEYYQTEAHKIAIPAVLQPYMGGQKEIVW
jgi:seryl-tRNA synthetase